MAGGLNMLTYNMSPLNWLNDLSHLSKVKSVVCWQALPRDDDDDDDDDDCCYIIIISIIICKEWTKKGSLEEFWNGAHLEDKKEKTSKYMDAVVYYRKEREGNWWLEMGRQIGVEKKNKFIFGTERCENM